MKDPEKELYITWSKKEKDILIHYPHSCDGYLLHDYFCSTILEYDYLGDCQGKSKYRERKSLRQELEERGYDISTLRFSIKLKDSKNNDGSNPS